MEITVRVCNVCGQVGRETKRYTIGDEEGNSAVVDLCDKDDSQAALLYGDLSASPSIAKPSATRRRRNTPSKVMTMEEIEALKK